jgi:hypothetical protein
MRTVLSENKLLSREMEDEDQELAAYFATIEEFNKPRESSLYLDPLWDEDECDSLDDEDEESPFDIEDLYFDYRC